MLSGKGGTGKTCLSAAFAHLAALEDSQIRSVIADADVDASNLDMLLLPQVIERQDFKGGKIAEIDQTACESCGICAEVCRFDAVQEANGIYQIDSFACDGCAACVYQCPEEAIAMREQVAGEWFFSHSRFGPLFHASLRPAQENSGKLVTLVKQKARLLALDGEYDLVLVDGPPGIGCPVISASSGADLALIVAEPTVAGMHDMRRVLNTTDHFGVKAMVCINKADLYPQGTQEIESFCRENRIEMIGHIPFDLNVTEAMVQGQPITAFAPKSRTSQSIRKIWARLEELLVEKAS